MPIYAALDVSQGEFALFVLRPEDCEATGHIFPGGGFTEGEAGWWLRNNEPTAKVIPIESFRGLQQARREQCTEEERTPDRT